MEAATLPKKKKVTINKGKLKKTIKNVLCRPDPSFWPLLSEEQSEKLKLALEQHKIPLTEFKKPNWSELKSIPKNQRPKPPKIKKVDGLIFGLSECSEFVRNGQCSAILIEALVNPQIIVEPLIESCVLAKVPVLCSKELKNTTATNFGIPTSCLGIRKDCLPNLMKEILDIFKHFKMPERTLISHKNIDIEMTDPITKNNDCEKKPAACLYLFRSSKKIRVFQPSSVENKLGNSKGFIGQDFIEFSEKINKKIDNPYMKMKLKRISNNPNRAKVK